MKNKLYKKLSLALAAVVMVTSVFSGVSLTASAETGYVTEAELTEKQTEAPAADDVIPDANQYRYQKEELSAFCHFGPNTFNEIEWGEHYGNRAPSEIFTLRQDFDADKMVSTLKEAGFEKLIVTAKHHDGFCIWDSQWTEYDVAASNYEDANGNSDILAEISAACTEHDMDMGLYLSPWDIHDASYGYYDANGNATNAANDVLDYNEYYNNQLEEILGNNEKYGNAGHFTEVWMDGAKGSGANAQEYDFVRWFNTIQKHEGIAAGYDADCMLFGAEAYTTVRWIGNENGYAAEETWAKSTVNKANNTINSNSLGGYTKGFENGNQWTVPEADARITSGWFWGTQKCTPKSIADLANMYFGSVGHNSVLLLNVPPNNQGTVDKAILDRVTEFGNEIKDTFNENLAANASVSATEVRGNDLAYKPSNVIDGDDATYWTTEDGTTTGSMIIDLGSVKNFDVVSIEEAIQFGQRITSFKVEYRENGGEWKTFDEGTTVGSKRLSRKATVKADQIKITVSTESTINANPGVPMLSEVGVYKASAGFELVGAAPVGMEVIDITDSEITLSGGWTQETGMQYVNGTNAWANGNASGTVSATVSFTGTKAYFIGTQDPNHGKADVYIDNVKVASIDTNVSPRKVGQILYASPDLADGEHTMKIVATQSGKAIGLEAAYVINNGGIGMVGIEEANYTMNEDSELEVKLVRTGGSKGEVTVTMSPNPGSAIQDDFDTELIETVTFAEGETEKTATVRTTRNTKETGDQYFTVELSSENEELILGFNAKARITITDTESIVEVPDTTDPADDSMDIPVEQYTATAGSTQSGNSTNSAIDGNTNSYWEVAWGEGGRNFDNLWYQIELDEATSMQALRYLPRYGSNLNGGEANGFIRGYRVEVSMDGTDWETAAEGTWTLSEGWKIAEFEEPVIAKYVRLVATDTYAANGTNLEMSITEVRVKAAPDSPEYTEKRPFVFPTELGASATLEAEYATLHNDGNTGQQENGAEKWALSVTEATWASNGKFVNCLNRGDRITIPYKAEQVGTYEVTVTYRSGSTTNYLNWFSTEDKIVAGNTSAGNADSSVTKTETFEMVVATAGTGVLTFNPVDADSPQLDKFDIVLRSIPAVPVDKADLAAAIEAAEELTADAYTEETWVAFAEALEAAKEVNEDATATQEAVDEALADLTAAQNALVAKPVDPQPPVEPVNPFEDVYDTDYYYDPVLWAVENGVTDGWTETTFAPNMGCTRGQVVTFLWRAAGEPEAENAENPFTDVAENAYYYDAVLWAVENGITDGWTATTFAPDMTCTRGQIVTFIWRAAGEVEVTAENPFTDVVENAYYYDAVLWAVENGITDGWTATEFAPDMECTRGQVVTFLYRHYNPTE